MILIDKPIPEDCDDCFCNDDDYRCGLLNEGFPLHFSGRLPNCPLREMEKVDDLIRRQAAIDALGEEPYALYRDDYMLGRRNQYREDKNALKQLQSVQPEIIRCKDCKHSFLHEVNRRTARICGRTRMCGTTPDDWYCADAERRTDG